MTSPRTKSFQVMEGDKVRHMICHSETWSWVLTQCEQYHLRPVDFIEVLLDVAKQPIEAALDASYGFRSTQAASDRDQPHSHQ
jgi:hypothetical protein